MNNVREIQRINERELDLAVEGQASWHDDYKDSAYIFVGNLDKRLTEGDVIQIFSQYGEILDINLPRIPEGGLRQNDLNEQKQQRENNVGKPGDRRGFGFLLFEDQRSTVLAVDNLNGFELLGRTLRVDHVKDYKMPKRRNEEGEVEEPTGPSRNAAPSQQQSERDRSADEMDKEEDIDMEDPMAKYIARSKSTTSKDDSKEEKRRRKEERRIIREERERRRRERDEHDRYRHRSARDEDHKRHRHEDERRYGRDRDASPKRSRREDEMGSDRHLSRNDDRVRKE